jgi:hypothetical protein
MRCPSCGGRPLVTSAVQTSRDKERADKAEAECNRLQAAFDEQLTECIHLNAANDAEQKRADRAFSAGARAFAEWMVDEESPGLWLRPHLNNMVARFLASRRGDGEKKED